MQISPDKGCTSPLSSGHSKPSSGRATSSVTRPPLRGCSTPSTVSGRSAAALTRATPGSASIGVSRRTTQSGSNGSRSASRSTRTSPRAAATPPQPAAPLPEDGQPGSRSAAYTTRAPAAAATSAVASVEPESTTTTSSTSPFATSTSTTQPTTAPTVSSSSSAGTTTDTVVEPLYSSNSFSDGNGGPHVRRRSHSATVACIRPPRRSAPRYLRRTPDHEEV